MANKSSRRQKDLYQDNLPREIDSPQTNDIDAQSLFISLDKDTEKALRKDIGYPNKSDNNYYKFNRFQLLAETDPALNGYSYIFVTRPNLNLSAPAIAGEIARDRQYNVSRDDFFYQMYRTERGRCLMSYLTHHSFTDTGLGAGIFQGATGILGAEGARLFGIATPGRWIPILTNLAKSFTPKDTEIETEEIGESFIGNKLTYGRTKHKSETASSIDIEYRETQELDVLLLHKLWVDYIHNVKYGIFTTHPDSLTNRELDYVASIYYFLTDPSGSRIKYYCRYTGVYPTNVPYSSLNWTAGSSGLVDLTISYSYSFKEDMKPILLYEFDIVSGAIDPKNGRQLIKRKDLEAALNDPEQHLASKNWAETPVVVAGCNETGRLEDFYLIFI